jgi:hypothetical protein
MIVDLLSHASRNGAPDALTSRERLVAALGDLVLPLHEAYWYEPGDEDIPVLSHAELQALEPTTTLSDAIIEDREDRL